MFLLPTSLSILRLCADRSDPIRAGGSQIGGGCWVRKWVLETVKPLTSWGTWTKWPSVPVPNEGVDYRV